MIGRTPRRACLLAVATLCTAALAGCADDNTHADVTDAATDPADASGDVFDADVDGAPDAADNDTAADASQPDADTETDAHDAATDADTSAAPPVRIVTFNTGSGAVPPNDPADNNGYGVDQQQTSDTYYGNGLAWVDVIDDVTEWMRTTQPDIVAFQEIFWTGECPSVPEDQRAGFVCASWADGDPTVALQVLGDGYTVACHPEKPDKCIGVRNAFGALEGCEDALCLDALEGYRAEGCGGGARVAAATVRRPDGDDIRVVSVHGTSGFTADDSACRLAQLDQVFVDAGDGAPLVDAALPNIVLGDFNTDPGRLAASDPSAVRWNTIAAETPFAFITAVGQDAPPTYTLFNIDHVVSDAFEGTCVHPGVGDSPAVTDTVYFDHVPALCELRAR